MDCPTAKSLISKKILPKLLMLVKSKLKPFKTAVKKKYGVR